MKSILPKRVTIVLLLTVALYGICQFSANSPKASVRLDAKPAEPPRKFRTYSGGPTISAEERSLESHSLREPVALVDETSRTKPDENRQLPKTSKEYVVDSGDTIVTEGYETEPGIFVLSTMELKLAGTPSEPKIAFKLSRAKVSLSGEYVPLVDDSDEIDSGRGYGAYNDRYGLYFRATVLPNGKKIKVTMNESEYEKSRITYSGGPN